MPNLTIPWARVIDMAKGTETTIYLVACDVGDEMRFVDGEGTLLEWDDVRQTLNELNSFRVGHMYRLTLTELPNIADMGGDQP